MPLKANTCVKQRQAKNEIYDLYNNNEVTIHVSGFDFGPCHAYLITLCPVVGGQSDSPLLAGLGRGKQVRGLHVSSCFIKNMYEREEVSMHVCFVRDMIQFTAYPSLVLDRVSVPVAALSNVASGQRDLAFHLFHFARHAAQREVCVWEQRFCSFSGPVAHFIRNTWGQQIQQTDSVTTILK